MKQRKLEMLVFVIILLLAAFLRFYNLPGYMTFLGDEGRDALMVKRILTTFDLPLIGPPMSVGNIYLGPLYYYMMTVAMTIFWLNPVAAAGMVALIGIATIAVIYWLTREWFGRVPAIVASLLYAISPITIIHSRSSWNPNPAPFFALLTLISIYLVRKTKNELWWIMTGFFFACTVQMHYLGLILLPSIGLLWLHELLDQRKKGSLGSFQRGTWGGIVAFLLVMSPLIVFDLRHNFMNLRAFAEIFFSADSAVRPSVFSTISKIVPIYTQKLILPYMAGDIRWTSWLISLVVFIPGVWEVYIWITTRKFSWNIGALYLTLAVGLMMLTFFNQEIYDHYLGFINFIPYILIGAIWFYLQNLKAAGRLFSLVFWVLLLAVIWFNFQKSPLRYPPGNQLAHTQEISKFIITLSANKPYNFALIAERNYDAAYQYYLWIYKHPPQELPFHKTGQLFVVCEDAVCNPVGHPKFEIAGFGWTKIESQFVLDGVKIFKLVHNEKET
ncbi:hypothetical protein A2631_03020 [Candidatus Daviesbacteria bacterium RIFCSPHIGHO2_01_FULL_44_29]|uniref:Glycosyltransferase RgtA/B/C/D-like domain-containing protein n=1 Tax=Candidatus Daviesbacteria bacterium RIFCSPHIGHO2_02_FULL_43_12 TaxID=1797776 RepID=A0A1F5KK95_9BACT|nr:MAG: hypothetical protein A2631_03020 [Candidatus Daviesbacteria bacterium RIFCSPHIGHO2_01_FULL_44_29]OGE40791.1 MAG: hypothetical protein A3E86_02325 [Candidatus Daviesbacteria bacterium RIFCSPHIGHO2_12_FULL_47_45]OGE41356.1 MAG: hypothetical protein A3D25_02415 [Candidatus Daviesbacteria bacterium RIFCSPHIGHO2_02_FULL_43_12]OGE69557.1 MAG: hypothetical protein A3B55_04160 [Candidatus Daviesbacteria bacterium RIFCSPLOWO2_01_FULL_43_15]